MSEYLVERMVLGGANKICFVIHSGKSDILEYYGQGYQSAAAAYVVQPKPSGLCDALFRATPLISAYEHVLIGLPDTVWFPTDGFRRLPDNCFALLLFYVDRPELFDSVILGDSMYVQDVQVKNAQSGSNWIWGAIKMPGDIFHGLRRLWLDRGRSDEFLGTLINAWIRLGNPVLGVCDGGSYVDVGTLDGYRSAMALLASETVLTESRTALKNGPARNSSNDGIGIQLKGNASQ